MNCLYNNAQARQMIASMSMKARTGITDTLPECAASSVIDHLETHEISQLARGAMAARMYVKNNHVKESFPFNYSVINACFYRLLRMDNTFCKFLEMCMACQ